MAKRRPFQRTDRIGSLVREVLSVALMRETREDVLRQVIITGVAVTRDLSLARVHYYLLGADTPALRAEVEVALVRATSFLRRRVGEQVRLRVTPDLRFMFDDSVARGQRIEGILAVLPELQTREAEPAEPGEGPDGEAGGAQRPVDVGDRPDGDVPDGDVPDGDVPDGDVPDGDMPDGDMPDSDVPDGERPPEAGSR